MAHFWQRPHTSCVALTLLTLQARSEQLQELRQVTVTDMFADNAGQVMPLLCQLVRQLGQGELVSDVVQVRDRWGKEH